MGKRGPQPASASELAARGSKRTKERTEAEAAAPSAVADRPRRRRPAAPEPPPRPLPDNPEAWRALCSMLPGYDPWALSDGYEFDPDLARHAIEWMEEHCRHIKGKLGGQRFRFEDSQRAMIANLFGWVSVETGLRRYRKCLWYVPRKNGKSSLSAAIGLYVLFEDGEPGAEIYCFASKRDQAKVVWSLMRSMVVKEPRLLARLDGGKPYVNSILLDDGESYVQTLTSEGKGEHGKSTHMGIGDELHAWNNPDLMEAVTTSMGAREQPILLLLTTADAVGETICNEELAYAKRVRDNKGDPMQPGHDPEYLPVIYEASVDDDWTDPEVWRKANPLYDTSPTIRKTLESEVRKAKDQPSYVNAVRRWYLNVQTETSVAWLRMDHWDSPACSEPFDPALLEGQPCYLGIDLSSKQDMTAVVAYFPDGGYVLPWYWVPEEAARTRERSNDPMYRKWAGAGHLTLTPGNVIDYDAILAQVDQIASRFKVLKIGIDPHMAMQVAIDLEKRGHAVEFVRQGWVTMTEPCGAVEVMIAKGELRHGGHPILRWNAANARVDVGKHGDKAPRKPKDSAKIDGIVCVLMAVRLATVEPVPTAAPRIWSLND